MTARARFGVIAFAAGVAVFMLGLYGTFRERSLEVAALGLVAIVAGIVVLATALRGVSPARPPAAIVVVAAAGAALHAYQQVGALTPFALGVFAWSLVPYALCIGAAMIPALRRAAIVAAIVVLAFDAWVHYTVFVAPTSSTASLALLFAPLWNTLVFAPVAMLGTVALARRV